MILSDIQTFLKAQSAVTAICSTRIYIGQAPQAVVYPYVAINKISDGINQDDTVQRPRIQFTCHGNTTIEGDLLVTAVRQAIHRYTGTMTTAKIIDTAFDNSQYFYDSTTTKHVYTMDMFLRYRS